MGTGMGVTGTAADEAPGPERFTPRTASEYVTPFVSPLMVKVVAGEAGTRGVQSVRTTPVAGSPRKLYISNRCGVVPAAWWSSSRQEGSARNDEAHPDAGVSRQTAELDKKNIFMLRRTLSPQPRLFLRAGVACLLLAGVATPAAALDPARAITQYMHDVWQVKDGLPQHTITAIAQTPDGYLWLGTREGLVRFDGVRFTVFDTQTTPALGHNFVLCLLPDRQGRLWIGTAGGGLARMERGQFTRFTTSDGLPHDVISSLFEDRGGLLWIGTDGGGLAKYDGQRFVPEPSRAALGSHVRAIVEDGGGLWVGTNAGLARLRQDGTLVSFDQEQGLSRNSVRTLVRDREGVLWIGTDLGLNRYQDDRLTSFTTRDGLSNDVIVSLAEDRDGNLWVGTDGGGLNRYRDGVFSEFTTRDGLSNNSVLALHEDREGSVWIGTNLGGLNRLKDGRFWPFTTREGLASDYVRAIYEDSQGALWFGTEGGGVTRVHDGRTESFTTRTGLSNDTVFAILGDRAGSLWFGTDSGLTRLKDGRFEIFTATMGMSNDSVLALHEDREGSLWIGTYAGGLNRYKDGRFTAFTTKHGLSNDTVNVIHEDREGVLWIGTRGGGLNRFQDGRFTVYTTKDGLSDNLVFALHEDRAGSLWIGTYGGGLTRLKNGRFASVTRKHGLFDDVIHRIIDDGSGQFWMTSNKGVFRVSKKELDEVADGVRPHLVPTVYGTVDGMRSAECNGGASAGTMTRGGRIWFPTVEGAIAIDPVRLRTNRLPPPVVIEDVLVDGTPLPGLDAFRLPSGAQTLEVHFTALSLMAPEAMRFRYRLEGLEDDWVRAETRRTAYYSKLPPGNYRFHVVASNNDGVWNEQGATLSFSVAPQLYETVWFRGIVALSLLLLGPVFYRVRIGRLTRQKDELALAVAERTSELNAANARLAQLAREDGLTGLLNRRAFDAAIAAECRRARRQKTPLSLVLFDIDFFKSFNDHYGHPAGDTCLRAVSDVVGDAHRRAGELVARYGGEELAVILPGVSADASALTTEQVRCRILELAIPHAGLSVAPFVTVSAGVACSAPGAELSAEELLAAADRALYLAKDLGRNRVEVGGVVATATAL